jgi:hypothetical protein
MAISHWWRVAAIAGLYGPAIEWPAEQKKLLRQGGLARVGVVYAKGCLCVFSPLLLQRVGPFLRAIKNGLRPVVR